jgi:hypothetical protein
VDARIAAATSSRQFTEQAEYARVRAALLAALGTKAYVRLTAAGAGLSEAQGRVGKV